MLAQSEELVNISDSHSIEAFNLSAHWAQGNVVALVRHAERCDKSQSPCLDGDTGITVRGKDMALKLGGNFAAFLPQSHTHFYNSPVKRTEQTARYMFKGASRSKEWLHESCKLNFLEDILKNKEEGVNMVLVTHSTCINNLHPLIDDNPATLHAGGRESYGITIFLAISKVDKKVYVLGDLFPDDWRHLSEGALRVARKRTSPVSTTL